MHVNLVIHPPIRRAQLGYTCFCFGPSAVKARGSERPCISTTHLRLCRRDSDDPALFQHLP